MKIDLDKIEILAVIDALEFSLIERKDKWLYENYIDTILVNLKATLEEEK